LGTLGFIASNRRETWLETFDLWSAGMLGFSRRLMLAVEAYRGQEKLYHGHALNDVVVSSEGNARMIRMCLSINGECFGNYRADGLIAATPTGSTAYNLAAGGPAVYPEMSALIINPICPFTLASRPLLVPGDMPIEITIEETRRIGALLTIDGQEMLPLCKGDSVLLSRHVRDVLLVVPGGNAFFHALRSKLGWSGGSDA
ncbi:MAG: NAD(+)/NADH kinase, partial [Spirochaetales bacterium]|nr:NAD(+)/NADH kinase [Spirochaetales bacterium]